MVVSDIFLDDQKVKEHLNEKNYPYYTNRNKTLDGNLGMVLQYLPDNIKNEIVKIVILRKNISNNRSKPNIRF